jgi:hypothetical protein
MPKLVGGLLALLALGASILSRVDPLECLLRAAIAYVIGYIATAAWYVFFTVRAGPPEDLALREVAPKPPQT